jgi:hypothetical protein
MMILRTISISSSIFSESHLGSEDHKEIDRYCQDLAEGTEIDGRSCSTHARESRCEK